MIGIKILALIFGLLLEGCGTEIGNGLRPSKSVTGDNGGKSSQAPNSEQEDSVDESSPTLVYLYEKIANTCASPAAFGAVGTFTSSESGESFGIANPAAGQFNFTYNELTLETALNDETPEANDIMWINEVAPSFVCSAVEGATEDSPMYMVTKNESAIFDISWTVVDGVITSITIDGDRFSKVD